MGMAPPSHERPSRTLRGRQSVSEVELRPNEVMELEQSLERLAEAVYHAQVYKDAPDKVREALEEAKGCLRL